MDVNLRLDTCTSSSCAKRGNFRCSICKSWYCSKLCQANHWKYHQHVCKPLPHLEWPNGSRCNIETISDSPTICIKNDPTVKSEVQILFDSSVDGNIGSSASADSRSEMMDEQRNDYKMVAGSTVEGSLGNEAIANSNDGIIDVQRNEDERVEISGKGSCKRLIFVENGENDVVHKDVWRVIFGETVKDVVVDKPMKFNKVINVEEMKTKNGTNVQNDECFVKRTFDSCKFYGWPPSNVIKPKTGYSVLVNETSSEDTEIDPHGARFGMTEEDFLMLPEENYPLLQVIMSKSMKNLIKRSVQIVHK